MIRVQIKKNNKITHQADFENASLASGWLDSNRQKNTFGKNLRELPSILVDGNYVVIDENVLLAISFRDVVNPKNNQITRYFTFPAEYEVITSNVTKEYDDESVKNSEISSLRSQLKQLHIDIQTANNINEIKPILIKLLRYVSLTN